MISGQIKSAFAALLICIAGPAYGQNALSEEQLQARKDLSEINGYWAETLGATVWLIGRSEHKHAPRPTPRAGTRIFYGNKKSSRLEGNRVLFDQIQPDQLVYLGSLRENYQDIAARLPLASLNSDEQLSFWLNLHNLVVYEQIARRYPVTDIRKLTEGERGKVAVWDRPLVTIEGRSYSLTQMEDMIMARWDDPLVAYGFFMGAVGTPNVRAEPYRAGEVWDQLDENAIDFVNSIRGTQIWGNRLRVSSWYRRAAVLFPDFERDVKEHVLSYIVREYVYRQIEATNQFSADIEDWNIADVLNGRNFQSAFEATGSILPNGGIALPAHFVELQNQIRARAARLRIDPVITLRPFIERLDVPEGEVTVEEFVFELPDQIPQPQQ